MGTKQRMAMAGMMGIKGNVRTDKTNTKLRCEEGEIGYAVKWHYKTNFSGNEKFIFRGKELGDRYNKTMGESANRIDVDDRVIYKGQEAVVKEVVRPGDELSGLQSGMMQASFETRYKIEFVRKIRAGFGQDKNIIVVKEKDKEGKLQLKKIPNHVTYICINWWREYYNKLVKKKRKEIKKVVKKEGKEKIKAEVKNIYNLLFNQQEYAALKETLSSNKLQIINKLIEIIRKKLNDRNTKPEQVKEHFYINLFNISRDNKNAVNDTIKLLNLIDEKEYAGRLAKVKETKSFNISNEGALRLIKKLEKQKLVEEMKKSKATKNKGIKKKQEETPEDAKNKARKELLEFEKDFLERKLNKELAILLPEDTTFVPQQVLGIHVPGDVIGRDMNSLIRPDPNKPFLIGSVNIDGEIKPKINKKAEADAKNMESNKSAAAEQLLDQIGNEYYNIDQDIFILLRKNTTSITGDLVQNADYWLGCGKHKREIKKIFTGMLEEGKNALNKSMGTMDGLSVNDLKNWDSWRDWDIEDDLDIKFSRLDKVMVQKEDWDKPYKATIQRIYKDDTYDVEMDPKGNYRIPGQWISKVEVEYIFPITQTGGGKRRIRRKTRKRRKSRKRRRRKSRKR